MRSGNEVAELDRALPAQQLGDGSHGARFHLTEDLRACTVFASYLCRRRFKASLRQMRVR